MDDDRGDRGTVARPRRLEAEVTASLRRPGRTRPQGVLVTGSVYRHLANAERSSSSAMTHGALPWRPCRPGANGAFMRAPSDADPAGSGHRHLKPCRRSPAWRHAPPVSASADRRAACNVLALTREIVSDKHHGDPSREGRSHSNLSAPCLADELRARTGFSVGARAAYRPLVGAGSTRSA